MAEAFFEFKEQRSAVAQLWLQALTESGDDPEIRRRLIKALANYTAVSVINRAPVCGQDRGNMGWSG